MFGFKQQSTIATGYVKHEFALFNLTMFLRMVFYGGVIGFVGFLLYMSLAFTAIEKPFEEAGFGVNVFRDYLLSKYIFVPSIPGAMMNLEPEMTKLLGKDWVTRKEYVRLLERLVIELKEPELLVVSEKLLVGKFKKGVFFNISLHTLLCSLMNTVCMEVNIRFSFARMSPASKELWASSFNKGSKRSVLSFNRPNLNYRSREVTYWEEP